MTVVSINRLGMDMGIIRIPVFRWRYMVDRYNLFIVKFLGAASPAFLNVATMKKVDFIIDLNRRIGIIH